jgi:hypothetical protein
MYVNPKNLPKQSQKRFYGFLMTSILPRVFKTFHEMGGPLKYLWDKPGQVKKFQYQIKIEMEKGNYINVIIMATIVLFQREKL